MARPDANGKLAPPFVYLDIDASLAPDHVALGRHLDLEAKVFDHIRANHAPTGSTSAGPACAAPAPEHVHAIPSPSTVSFMMSKIDPTVLQRRIVEGSLTPRESARYLIVDTEPSTPFTPVIRVNPATVAMPDEEVRSALVLNSLNWAVRLVRNAQFYRKLSEGCSGTLIAAEDDSWFQYPWTLHGVIDQAVDDFAVLCTSAAGDLLENMARESE